MESGERSFGPCRSWRGSRCSRQGYGHHRFLLPWTFGHHWIVGPQIALIFGGHCHSRQPSLLGQGHRPYFIVQIWRGWQGQGRPRTKPFAIGFIDNDGQCGFDADQSRGDAWGLQPSAKTFRYRLFRWEEVPRAPVRYGTGLNPLNCSDWYKVG